MGLLCEAEFLCCCVECGVLGGVFGVPESCVGAVEASEDSHLRVMAEEWLGMVAGQRLCVGDTLVCCRKGAFEQQPTGRSAPPPPSSPSLDPFDVDIDRGTPDTPPPISRSTRKVAEEKKRQKKNKKWRKKKEKRQKPRKGIKSKSEKEGKPRRHWQRRRRCKQKSMPVWWKKQSNCRESAMRLRQSWKA